MSVKSIFTVLSILLFSQTVFCAVDMTGWTEYDPYSRWSYSNPTTDSGRMDETASSQTVAPGFVISDFVLPSTASFSITLEVSGSGDDDFIGFVFGWQDSDHFYLLDWKRYNQNFNWGDAVAVNDDYAEQGLKVKKIDGSWTRDGLWGGSDGLGVSTIAGQTGTGWAFNTEYTFDVELSPGNITIKKDGDLLFDISDSSFEGGNIGLYGFSQDDLIFSNITYIPEPTTICLLGLSGLFVRARKSR